MQSFYPLFWISGIVALYLAVGMAMVLIWESVKLRNGRALLCCVGFAALAACICYFINAVSPVKYFLTTMLLLAGYGVQYFTTSARIAKSYGAGWRRKMVGTVATHLALLTGAVVFIIPFIWLVSTSLKEEDQIFKYPPVWIPTRQVHVTLHNKNCGVSRMALDGKSVEVAETSDLECGRTRVQILPGQPDAGKTMVVDAQHLSKVRKFGLRWQNYSDALNFLPKGTHKGLMYLWNTVYITVLSVLGTLFASSMVAYSFARLKWFGKEVCFGLLLATMMLPGAVTMMPVFLIFRWLGWVDTLRPLWVPSFFGSA
ncbi:hypothetical protein LLG39_07185, partial [bacterium]|nr:hypothetical protein [bacterium]